MSFWRKHETRSAEAYQALGQTIWTDLVPASGQSRFVQGELLRAIEKLRDEAQRNGNGNWDDGHIRLANFIRSTLTAQPDVPKKAKSSVSRDIERLLDFENHHLDDDLFDRVSHVILDWCALHPEPLPRQPDGELHR